MNFVSARYRIPLTPLLIAFSGYLLDKISSGRSLLTLSGITLCSCIVVIPNWFDLDINMWKSVSYYNAGISSLYNNGSASDSINMFNKAIIYNDADPYIYFELGNAQFKQGMYAESISSYAKAAALDKKQPKYIFSLAMAYKRMNDFENAKKFFSQALSEDPTMAAAYINMADIYLSEKNPGESLAYYTKAANIDPNNSYVKDSIKLLTKEMK